MNIGHSTNDPTSMGVQRREQGDTKEYDLDNLNQWWFGNPQIHCSREKQYGVFPGIQTTKTMPLAYLWLLVRDLKF